MEPVCVGVHAVTLDTLSKFDDEARLFAGKTPARVRRDLSRQIDSPTVYSTRAQAGIGN